MRHIMVHEVEELQLDVIYNSQPAQPSSNARRYNLHILHDNDDATEAS